MITTLTDRKQFGQWLTDHGFDGTGAEVGVAYGENAKEILDRWGGKMLLIDPYINWPYSEYTDGTNNINMEGALGYAKDLLKDHVDKIEWIRKTSDDAVDDLEDGSLDFVYLDGNHHNPQFQKDLDNYWPKVKEGGVFCGHDFYDLDTPAYKCEVESTVTKFCAERGLEIHNTKECSSWWVIK